MIEKMEDEGFKIVLQLDTWVYSGSHSIPTVSRDANRRPTFLRDSNLTTRSRALLAFGDSRRYIVEWSYVSQIVTIERSG